MNNLQAFSMMAATCTLFSAGCASVQRGMPVASTEVSVNLTRQDYTVIGPVKGTSTLASYLLGLVKIVDGDKVIVLNFKTFEDQYAMYASPETPLAILMSALTDSATAEQRAYYKALAATPDADVVIPKAYTKQVSGIPLLASTKEVTFSGKAVKIKAD